VASRVVVVFCMPDRGHFQRIRPIVAGLARQGLQVHVFTHIMFMDEVKRSGGIFADLFASYKVEHADDESWPPVCRYVSFAGRFIEQVRADVARLAPALIVHDTFAVIGNVVARVLGVPHVNVCAGHDVVPERFLKILEAHPRVHVSYRCRQAVHRLQTEFGLDDVSPFSYMSGMSPYLNLYCEPSQFLPAEDRHVFEPVAFYGSLHADAGLDQHRREETTRTWYGDGADDALKLYVSFGTAIWISRTAEALAALGAIAEWVGGRRGIRAVISLGRAKVSDAEHATLERPNIKVVSYLDQWGMLGASDVFLTHHGLNSTHEAIAHEVPMISYPFVWDQPGLAAVCQRLGLAVQLVDGVMAPVRPADVGAALESVTRNRESMRRALATAHGWERVTMDGRPEILRRIAALILP